MEIYPEKKFHSVFFPSQDKYFSSKNNVKNESGRLVPDLFLFLKEALYEVKASDAQFSFSIFR